METQKAGVGTGESDRSFPIHPDMLLKEEAASSEDKT